MSISWPAADEYATAFSLSGGTANGIATTLSVADQDQP